MAFKRDIIHTSQNKLQQSQDRGIIDLMCSLSDTDLPQGTTLEINEIDRDIWGENNKLVKLVEQLSRCEENEDQQADSIEEHTAASSNDDVCQGLAQLDLKQSIFEDKILDLEKPEPWWKPDFVQPHPAHGPKNHNNRRGNRKKSPGTTAPPKHVSHQNSFSDQSRQCYTSDISSMPQLPEPAINQTQFSEERVTTDVRSQSCQSSESQQVSVSSLEGQMEEQNLKSLETSSKSFWESQGDKVGRQQYREPKTKFAASQMTGTSAPGGRCDAENHNSTDIDGWKDFAAGNGGETHNDQRCEGSYQHHGARTGAGERGRGGGNGENSAGRGYVRATRSDNHNPFPPARGKQQGPPKACYNNRTPFGGWERAKSHRRV